MSLIGRQAELEHLAGLIEDIPRRGGALLLSGAPGAGKSALLAEVRAHCASAGLRVLAANGVQSEQQVPFAGLHQVLYPVRAGLSGLPAGQRAALGTALGLADGPAPEVSLVGLAVVNLLAETAPLAVLLDDVQWLDQASQEVLTFVARRLCSEPAVLIATRRTGEPSALTSAGLPELALDRLSAEAAAELLDRVAPDLPAPARARVLAQAEGNPLALTELPSTATETSPLPLTPRLERAFAARADALPAATRHCLLIAALHEHGALAEILAAAGLQPETGVAVLRPAAEAGLITLDTGAVEFRHPLVRSAIAQTADLGQRQAAHRALAEVLSGQPDRRAWHRAAATLGPDEQVAADLEATADRAQRRGGVATAISALERAAQLSEDPADRVRRLLRAAELAVDSGRRDIVDRVLAEVRALPLTARQRALAAWLPSAFDDGVSEGATGPGELLTLVEQVLADGDLDLAMRIFWGTAMRCFWVEPGSAVRERIIGVADRLPIPARDPRLVAITAYVAPIERGDVVVARLRELAAEVGGDPVTYRYLSSAALQVGALTESARFSAAAQPGLRAEGKLALVARALAVQAWSCVRLGDLLTAAPAAEEAAQLARETRQPYMYGLARAVQAEICALRGEYEQAETLAAEAEQVGLAAAARPVLAKVQLARGIAALGAGRYLDAFLALRRVHDPADPAYQLALRCYLLPELAEAGLRCDQADEVRKIVAELESAALSTSSPALTIGLRYARAVLAADDRAESLFRTALEADLTRWPLERGRLQLAFGEWLRRQRRPADSRPYLRAARETFDALGMPGWSERARRDLRATGEASPEPREDAYHELTAHELNIARLAADGLTNREIGERLYLSHRTVSTHLHRIFPKLGITSRTELGAALQPSPA
ncbi:ATP-binding protein [Crossiella sp. CA198]|uniref:ATP-binding protein n=1 Tax=Crossiella sp. CA198 TaxID=3455607 RepID=UPI003F8D8CA7